MRSHVSGLFKRLREARSEPPLSRQRPLSSSTGGTSGVSGVTGGGGGGGGDCGGRGGRRRGGGEGAARERQRLVAQLASDSDGSAEEGEGGYPAEEAAGGYPAQEGDDEQAASYARPSRSRGLNIDKKAPAVRLHLTASAGGRVQARVWVRVRVRVRARARVP